MAKNIDYLPRNFRSKYYTKSQTYNSREEAPSGEIDINRDSVKDEIVIDIDNTRFIKKTREASEVKIVVDNNVPDKDALNINSGFTKNILDSANTRALTFSNDQVYSDSNDDPEKNIGIFDGRTTNKKEELEDDENFEEATVSKNGTESIVIDSSFVKVMSSFSGPTNEYIKDTKVFILTGSQEQEEKFPRRQDVPATLQVKMEKTIELLLSDEKRNFNDAELQAKVFLYGAVPYLLASPIARTIKNQKVFAEGSQAEIASAVYSAAVSAFSKLEDARYFTLKEFLRLSIISFSLNQFNMPRGITVKKLKKLLVGYETEDFTGSIDLKNISSGDGTKPDPENIWKAQRDYLDWAGKRPYGLNDIQHVAIINLKEQNAITYSGGEAGYNRLFNTEDYQPLNFRTSGYAYSPYRLKTFSTYEISTLVKKLDDINSVGTYADGIVSSFTLSSEQNSPDYLRTLNSGNLLTEVERTRGGGIGKVEKVNINTLPISKLMTDVDNTILDTKYKGKLYDLGYVYVMPFSTTYKAFSIPFQFNPNASEGGAQAKYTSTSFIARVGELQTYINTSALTSVSLTTSYLVLTDGSVGHNGNGKDESSVMYSWENKYTYDFVSTIENMYRSLIYPAFKEESTSGKSFEYVKPPVVRICVGGAASKMFSYPKKITTKGVEGDEPSAFRNFVVTGVTINKDAQTIPYIYVDGGLTDTMGFEVNLTMVEVSRNYLDVLPDFNDYYETFKNVVDQFNPLYTAPPRATPTSDENGNPLVEKIARQREKIDNTSAVKDRKKLGVALQNGMPNGANGVTEEKLTDESGTPIGKKRSSGAVL